MSQIETVSQPQAVSMADEWFHFANADHFWMQWRHRILLRAIKCAGTRCGARWKSGAGTESPGICWSDDLGIPVDGCDLNRTALEMAKPGKGKLFIYNVFDQEPSLLGRYDAVFLLDVLEHIDDDLAFLRAALRHLRSGGLVVVNVPASMLSCSVITIERLGHLRRYTTASLTTVIEAEWGRRRNHPAMGVVDGSVAARTQGHAARSKDRRRHSRRFRATKRNLATVTAGDEEH